MDVHPSRKGRNAAKGNSIKKRKETSPSIHPFFWRYGRGEREGGQPLLGILQVRFPPSVEASADSSLDFRASPFFKGNISGDVFASSELFPN